MNKLASKFGSLLLASRTSKGITQQEVAEAASIEAEKVSSTSPYIVGSALVYPYDIVEYKAQDIKGNWFISDESLARFVSTTEDSAVVEIITGKSGKFTLYCGELGFPISIESL